jgi:hypothetical protein
MIISTKVEEVRRFLIRFLPIEATAARLGQIGTAPLAT